MRKERHGRQIETLTIRSGMSMVVKEIDKDEIGKVHGAWYMEHEDNIEGKNLEAEGTCATWNQITREPKQLGHAISILSRSR